MKIKVLITAAIVLSATHTAQACDIDAAKMAIQGAQLNADEAASADDLEDARSAADDAESDAANAAIYLADCY
ncbi:MAG: hypothetical protein ACDS79_15295 [Enterobacteriaceae bacterium]